MQLANVNKIQTLFNFSIKISPNYIILAAPSYFLLSKIRNFKLGPKRLKLENLKQKRKQIEIGTRKDKS